VTTEHSAVGVLVSRTQIIPVRVQADQDPADMASKVLYLAASPPEMVPLRIDQEMREIQQALNSGRFRDEFRLVPSPAVRVTDISYEVINKKPRIIHFAGHGGADGQLYAEDSSGSPWPVTVDGMVRLVNLSANTECVIINACHTERLAYALGRHVKYVIGMHQAVGDRAAIGFSIGFYQALFAKLPIEDAFMAGLAGLSARQQRRRDTESPFLLVDGRELAVDRGPERWVSIDVTAAGSERAAVQALVDELDIDMVVRADYASRAAGLELPWVITMAVPVTTFLTAFAKKFGERAGDTAGDVAEAIGHAFVAWVRRLYQARIGVEGSVTLYDRERGLDVVIARDLPARAYHELRVALDGRPGEAEGRPTELRWSENGWVASS